MARIVPRSMAFAAGSTCWACRSTQARLCASCVLQAMSERALRLQEIESERARLEKVMVEGLRRRQRAVQLQETRREHAAEMSRLSAELEEVRGETERRAVEVNELRRQRLAETSAPPPSSAASPAPTFAAAATAQRLSDVRRIFCLLIASIMRSFNVGRGGKDKEVGRGSKQIPRRSVIFALPRLAVHFWKRRSNICLA